jgi:hypothetical protein
VSLVHGPWTTGALVHRGPASIADWRSSLELGLRVLRATMACRDCTGRTRSSPGFSLGPHPRQRSGVAVGRWRWHSVRVLLKHEERRRRVGGGAVEDGGVLPLLLWLRGGGRAARD